MKKDFIKTSGTITDCLPGTMFEVEIENTKKKLLCHLSGKMRINSIRLLVGDKVSIEISPYDLGKGRICFREK